jgi:hypothetical protein
MHLLRLSLATWFAFGTVSLFFLFWLYKRTARRINTLDKAPIAQYDVQPLASLNDSAVPSFRERRPPRSDDFFWRVARAVAMAAVFALLLVSSTDRPSPLPARLVVQQQEPLRRVVSKAIVMEPQATKTGPNQRTVDAGKTGRRVSAATHRTIVKRTGHSIYESEADMVAPDTVMRYGRRPSVVDAGKTGRRVSAATHRTIVKRTRHSVYESEADMVAPDTVMRYVRQPSVAR